MRVYQYCHWVVDHVGRLQFHQFALLVLAIVVFGVICLRGFGSRSNYYNAQAAGVVSRGA